MREAIHKLIDGVGVAQSSFTRSHSDFFSGDIFGIREATGNSSGGHTGSALVTSGVAGNPVIDTERTVEDEEEDNR